MPAFVLLVLCILALNGYETVIIHRKCSTGWEKFGQYCYKYMAESKKWAEAEQNCLSLGGNLASVHNKETQNFLKDFTKKQTGSYERTWIGLHDAPQDFIWLWSDGTKFDFSAWHSGEPSNGGWAEKCVEMNYGDEVLWNDDRCNHDHFYVCQKRSRLDLPNVTR
ncbi:ladderlectin-like [Brachyhypopomus gauderio]|uniref:ladderlectin-like n=1 Tax=Brachyhypopomus gauderio TaxID=698409 RepID=UPI004041A006